MTDFVTLQQDIFFALMSRQELLSVNVKQFRKMVIQSEIDMKLVYLTARNGKSGAGILVEMPTLTSKNPSVSGPVLDVDFSVLIMEQPTINMSTPNGTLLSAEEIALLVTETLHLLSLGSGGLRASPNAIVPATEYRGVVAYRVHANFVSATAQTARTGYVQVVQTGGAGNPVTIGCSSDPSADIFYTLDGTFPANVNGGNPQSVKYTTAIAADAGVTVRACAYASGKLGGSVANLTVK